MPGADGYDRLGRQRSVKRVRLVGEHALRVARLDLDHGGGLVVIDDVEDREPGVH